jgi:hypothetical protein
MLALGLHSLLSLALVPILSVFTLTGSTEWTTLHHQVLPSIDTGISPHSRPRNDLRFRWDRTADSPLGQCLLPHRLTRACPCRPQLVLRRLMIDQEPEAEDNFPVSTMFSRAPN